NAVDTRSGNAHLADHNFCLLPALDSRDAGFAGATDIRGAIGDLPVDGGGPGVVATRTSENYYPSGCVRGFWSHCLPHPFPYHRSSLQPTSNYRAGKTNQRVSDSE